MTTSEGFSSPRGPGERTGCARNQKDRWNQDRRPIDWGTVRDRIDLADVATRLLGPAPGRRGEGGRRLWWCCPFHEDRNPSFCVEPGKMSWRCYGCGAWGDAIALVMRHNRLAFREALQFVLEGTHLALDGGSRTPRRPSRNPDSRGNGQPPPAKAAPEPTKPSGWAAGEARGIVDVAAELIWMPDGAQGLAYLRGRGLDDATIRLARLGWMPSVMIRTKDGKRAMKSRGVTIPWFDGDRLALVKLRQPPGREPRYLETYRDRPDVYPGPPLATIREGDDVVIVEGELDALLLGQELKGLAPVITTGSASSGPSRKLRTALGGAFRLFLATDADPAGDGSARHWYDRAIRIRPPGGHKDWTDAKVAGIDLRSWWISSGLLNGHHPAPGRRTHLARPGPTSGQPPRTP